MFPLIFCQIGTVTVVDNVYYEVSTEINNVRQKLRRQIPPLFLPLNDTKINGDIPNIVSSGQDPRNSNHLRFKSYVYEGQPIRRRLA